MVKNLFVFMACSVFISLATATAEHSDEQRDEGLRIEMSTSMATTVGIETSKAETGEIVKRLGVFGKIKADSGRISHVRARFPGTVVKVNVQLGDQVKKGQLLAQVESNSSLERYRLTAPFAGIITARHATEGEFTEAQVLFTVANFDVLWAELSIFPSQLRGVKPGLPVIISLESQTTQSVLEHLIPSANGQPFSLARASIDNQRGEWTPGMLVEGEIFLSRIAVPLLVSNSALQNLDGEFVVFVQDGNHFEARKLELGRRDRTFTEVLSGLELGEVYVSKNSYLLKADLEKSGAEHSH
jgi:cobalt-zinc-cadmium efflux system membrane fusion protein